MLAMAAIAAIAASQLMRAPIALTLNLATSPQTIYVTNPFPVGETYTFGSTAVPPNVKRPVRITGIRVLHSSGVEILGVGALEPGDNALGLVPGWPPPKTFEVHDPFAASSTWSSEVQALVGIRTTSPKSGLRGIALAWSDADGIPGERVFDFAVVTCAPGACAVDTESEALMRELGLMK